MELRWHAQNPVFLNLSLLDRDPTDDMIDVRAVRTYRLRRVREEMARYHVDACLLFDPVNIRYATDSRNMQVFSSRNPARYLFLPLTGPVVLFEFTGCEHLAAGLETIDEIRPAITASFVAAGDQIAARERLWAREIAALIRQHCGPNATVGVERVNAGAAVALAGEGFNVVDAQQPVERARAVKSVEELKCIRSSIRATERGVAQLREALRPGLTEQQLWSVLHQAVIAQGGDYIETRLLSSGQRTNPWFQEASESAIQPNELVALDTDVVGCFGYYADFSRTFHSGPGRPTSEQRELYRVAYEQVQHNMGIIKPGMTFKEYSEQAWDIPSKYEANRYYLSAHGVGMTGEYPYLYHRRDYGHAGYDGVFEPNMTICVESYIGADGGAQGVKLEQHCLVTESELVALSQFPFEESLLGEAVPSAADVRLLPGSRLEAPQPSVATNLAITVDLTKAKGRERDIRAAISSGAATVEIVVTRADWADRVASRIALRRVIDPAREQRIPFSVSIDAADLSDSELDVVGHLARQLRISDLRLQGRSNELAATLADGGTRTENTAPSAARHP